MGLRRHFAMVCVRCRVDLQNQLWSCDFRPGRVDCRWCYINEKKAQRSAYVLPARAVFATCWPFGSIGRIDIEARLVRRALIFSAVAILIVAMALAGLNRSEHVPAPIRVGVLHSLSGPMAGSEMPLIDAVRMAVEEINADGGLLGRMLEIVVADGRSDPEVFAAEARRLIEAEGVSVLFGCWTSACRKAVKPVVEANRHLLFYPLQYEGLEQSDHVIYTGSAPNQQIVPGARWALDRFGTRVFLIGSDYIFPRAANLLIDDIVRASSGVVLAERYLPLTANDFEPVIDEILAHSPDVILNTLNGDGNRYFFAALKGRAIDVPVVSFSVAEPELQAMGPQLFHPEHYTVWGYFQSLDTPANREFVTAFRKRFGPERVTSDPIEASYNGVRLWANAVRMTSSEAPEDVNRNIVRQSLPGPSGVVAVDPGTRHVWRTLRIGKALPDGQFELVETSTRLVRPSPFPVYRSRDDWRELVQRLDQSIREHGR